ncbi:hypothetical protein PENTCL1PPCAC_19495, partial [Pristionchus entomophagus]
QDFIPLNIGFNTQFVVPKRLGNHYLTTFERLGTGTYGTVLRFKSKTRDKNGIAIKFFTNVFKDVPWANLALRELNLLNNTKHDNVVRMLGAYFVEDGLGEIQSVYHITEYCGRDLKEVIEKGSKYSMQQVKSMMNDLLRACKYLNSAGIIHRDVKPENMCIDDNWKLTLLDLGLARVIDRNNKMTQERGSHPYMSIEMLMEWTGTYDERADVWSIGAILCELLTGQVFFELDGVKHPIEAAIRMCGPIPDSVLNKIGKDDIRERFKKKSRVEGVERTKFKDYLEEEGLPWLANAIRLNMEDLVDFIDYALQFEQEMRMSVDYALAHRLLSDARDLTREVFADSVVPDELPLPRDDDAMTEMKRRIRAEIDAAAKFLD